MASGEVVADVLPMPGPSSSFAPAGYVGGASSPVELTYLIGVFDDATDEYTDFIARLRGYDGGGLTIYVAWTAAGASPSGTARIGIAIRALDDDAADGDLDASFTYDFNTAGFTAPSAQYETVYDSITFTDGADMDSWADGETAIIRFYRDGNGTTGTDSLSGDFCLLGIEVYET